MKEELLFPDAEVIKRAHTIIEPFIHRTPVMHCETFDKMLQMQLFFKCENFQKVGAFKYRGATCAVASLPKEISKNGVATHSSGNHAQALALAAAKAGIKAYIVMPDSAPAVKKAAVAGYGAEIIPCAPTLAARESTLEDVVARTGAHVIHPYNDYRVISGQATCALELLEDIQNLDVIIAPVGGGGLISGTALSAHYFSPSTMVYGAEPEGADDAMRSLQAGYIIPSENPQTIADGLLTSLGDKTFPIIQKHVKDIFTASDKEIIKWMQLVWQRMKIIIEPSCAVPLAALALRADQFKNKRIGVIFTGGNVDFGHLPF
ncbi:MAG: pyridoxal-phosphate dependent enzyme [Cyclobacteriaceae bacterium]|nr:pyridoxal-phosphate dependent enzyme [Cyclobacteriaceae bacterium]